MPLTRVITSAASLDVHVPSAHIASPLLVIDNLRVTFLAGALSVVAVRCVSLAVYPGETVALVGESGSGKSVTAHAVLRLLPGQKRCTITGNIQLGGTDVLAATEAELRNIRGNRIGMVFQEPMSSLNPLHRVGRQIGEMLLAHQTLSSAAVRAKVLELLELVGLDEPKRHSHAFPHELSGGQRQRIMLAIALANRPALLIADEPTTALDSSVQARILEQLAALKRRLGMALLLITHDLGIVRRVADRVAVMRAGEVVECAPAATLFAVPRHTYTQQLLNAEISTEPCLVDPGAPVLLEARNLKVCFPIRSDRLLRPTSGRFQALDDVSLTLREGHSLGIVGESGSGKSTLGLALLRLIATQGEIIFAGRRLDILSQKQMRPLRRELQVVLQDPFSSLSPRMRLLEIVIEGLSVHGVAMGLTDTAEQERRVLQMLTEVGIDPKNRYRYAHEFSAGQRQRIAIARALVLQPRCLILDEPTSSLDRTVQFQVVQLLRELQKLHSLAYLFITHDLKLVRALCHDVLVLHGGKVVEAGSVARVFETPQESYTRALLAAML